MSLIHSLNDAANLAQLAARPLTAAGDGTTDDIASINAQLASAPAGAVLRGVPGRNYLISSPMVLRSGGQQTLDLTGCTITLKAASASGQMLVNAAVTAQRSVTDGAMTSGTATLTSASAAFTGADVGRTVHVPGAAAFGQMLVADITAVGSTTSATLSLSAGTTVSATTVSIYDRDTAVTIIGGTWDKQGNDGTGTGRHTIVLRHVDGITIRDQEHRSTAGKYALSLGGWTNLLVENIRFPRVQSDGVHLHGPGRSGVVRNVYGTTGDDLVSVTPQDWAAFNDIQGDITDVAIENVFPVGGGVRGVNIIASRSTAARRIRVRNVFGSLAGTAPAVHIGDDVAGGSEFAGGAFDVISVENVSTTVPTNVATVLIDGTAMKRVRVSGVHFDNPAAAGAAIIDVAPATAGTIRALTIENVTVPNSGGQPIIRVGPNATVGVLTVDKMDVENLSASAWNAVFVQGTVADLLARGVTGVAGNGGVVNLDGSRAAATVNRCSINGVRLRGVNSSAMVVATNSGHTLPVVEVADAVITSMAWVADLNTVTELHLSSVSTTAPFGIFNIRANANVTVRGSGFNLGAGSQGLQVAAGGVLRSKTLDLACDVSKLGQADGDQATNTNAGLPYGTGAVISNGSAWRRISQSREIREYTATTSSVATPTGIIGAFVTCIQGGHSGGSGRQGAAATVRGGGQGGSPAGLVNEQWIPASMWGATYTVTVGSGGAGGAAIATVDTNGNPGTIGTVTSVATGSITVRASGGSPAGGGTTSGGTGGSAGAPVAGTTTSGGTGGTGAAGSIPTPGYNLFNPGPAGGGGGISAGDVAFAGGAGRGVDPLATSGGAAGAVGAAAPNAPALVAATPGGGGGGGAASTTAAAQAGADGLGYGSPGGGGGASLNGFASGKGGNGGPGYARLTFLYA